MNIWCAALLLRKSAAIDAFCRLVVHLSQFTQLQIRSMKLSEFQEKHAGDLSGPALEDIKSRQQAFTAQLMVPPSTSMQPSIAKSTCAPEALENVPGISK